MAEERIEIEPVLESVLRYCIDDARKRMEEGNAIAPFSALAVGETLFMEEHPADDPAESFSSARKTVAGARGAQAYGFCYDGFVEAENPLGDGLVQRDCIIAEGGTPGAEYGHAIGLTYQVDAEGNVKFAKEPIYVSKALNYMANIGDGDDDVDGVEVFTGAAEPGEGDAEDEQA